MIGAISRLNVTDESGEVWARTPGVYRIGSTMARASSVTNKHRRFIPGPRCSIPRSRLRLASEGDRRAQPGSHLPVRGSWEQGERGQMIRTDCQCGRGKPERL